MAARNWILLALTGAALAGPACVLVLGAEELPVATGGAGTISTTGGTTSSSSSSATSSSSSSTSSSGATSSSTSSTSAGGACAATTTCSSCMRCMEGSSACAALGSACMADYPCNNYFQCVTVCSQDDTFNDCAVGSQGCSGSPVTNTNYLKLKSCTCPGCLSQCSKLCP